MKQRDMSLEIQGIVSILDSPRSIRKRLLPMVRIDHFSFDSTREIFERMQHYLRKENEVVSSRVLVNDPAISGKSRKVIRRGLGDNAKHPDRIMKQADIAQLVEQLEKYKLQRQAYSMARNIVDEIGRPKPNHDRLFGSLGNQLLLTRNKQGGRIVHIGEETTDKEIFEKVLSERQGEDILPTGLKVYDEITGGFALTELVVLSSNFGGGKSTVAMQIALHHYKLGFDSIFVSLEMSERIAWERVYSHISGIDSGLVHRGRLSEAQKQQLREARRDFIRHGKEKGCRFTIYRPGYIDARQLCDEIRPYGYTTVVVDYVNLMKPLPEVATADERIRFGETAKELKLKAGDVYLNCVMILLAQLNDENRVKYSGAISEHCDTWIWWRRGNKEKATHQLIFDVGKGRNSETFRFSVKDSFNIMRVDTIERVKYDTFEAGRRGIIGRKKEGSRVTHGQQSSEDSSGVKSNRMNELVLL